MQGGLFAGYDNLAWRVEVSYSDLSLSLSRVRARVKPGCELSGDFSTDFLQWFRIHANDGSHAAWTDSTLIMHQASAFAHQLNGILHLQRAGGDQSGILAHAVTGGVSGGER